MDGVEVCRQLRTFSDAYVVMLTARDDEVDTLIGLSVGADDYMTKPFSPRELVARLRAMLRRPRPLGLAAPQPIAAACAALRGADDRPDGPRRVAPRRAGRRSPGPSSTCSPRSPRGRGWPSAADSCVDAVWGETWVGDEHLVDVHIGHLRRKLGDDATEPRFIRTVRGVGYRMGTGE